jgi:ABC-2 type transport system permease protein
MCNSLANVYHLGIKEFRSLLRDPIMLVLIVWVFTFGIYGAATMKPENLRMAPMAIADEDRSTLSARIGSAFYEPYFIAPVMVTPAGMDRGMDQGVYSFALDIPPNFQRDVLAGRNPSLQLNVDATQIGQAFIGAGYIQAIVASEIAEFVQHARMSAPTPIELVPRIAYNPNLTNSWFTAVMEAVNHITLLSIVLTGAALIREREHGTVEHLLVMPLQPWEIMLAKVWSMGVVVLIAAALCLKLVVQAWLGIPIHGSIPLFIACTGLYLFATSSMGILLGTVARSMPQFALLMILVLLPLEILSGTMVPRESMPLFIQRIMTFAPTTHFVAVAQAILYRGAGLSVIWSQLIWLVAIGGVFFTGALLYFRRAIGHMQA